jgi:small subunit ribosomal protein S8
MTNYPVGDFLIRIKNAALAKNRKVSVRKTKLIKAVANALKKEGYLDNVKQTDGRVDVRLSFRHKEPVMLNLKLVSKPGLRVYKSFDELGKLKGPSVMILTTAKGVLSHKDAIKKHIGGEVMVELW